MAEPVPTLHAPAPASAPGPAPGPARAWLTLAVALLWVALHLGGLWASDAPLGGRHVLLWGAVPPATQVQAGALVPARVGAGEPWRLLTGAGVVAPGLLGLLLGLWVLSGSVRSLEPLLGRARLLLLLVLATLAGAATRVLLDPAAREPQAAGWDLVLGAVGARIPLGLALGGSAGRQMVSGSLAWVALAVLLAWALPGTPLAHLAGEGAGLCGGVLAVLLLGPRRCLQAPPARPVRVLAAGAALAVLACAGLQAHAALGGAGREPQARAWLERLAQAERSARARVEGRTPPSSAAREGLPALLDGLEADAPLGSDGAAREALHTYVESLAALPHDDLRDPSLTLGRLKRGYAAWAPHEARLRARAGLLTRAVPPWR
ncbi:MAG: hypothetical protein ACKOSS_02930 [Planctomycetia bacterium]